MHQFRRTTLWTAVCFAFLAGIGLARRFEVPPEALWFLAVPLGLSIVRKNLRTLILVSVAAVLLGVWRGGLFMDRLDVYRSLYLQEVLITGRSTTDGIYAKGGQISFEVKDASLESGERLAGKIQVRGFGVNAIYQDDVVRVRGKLYPARGSAQGRISYGQIELIHRNPRLVPEIRRKFAAGIQTALPQPVAPFALGILVGQRATLPEEVKDDLLKVGLTHIIAVSGYNLTIILHATRGLLGKQSKRIGTGLSLGLIVLFLLITGASASIVRAAIVSGLGIVAAYYGRSIRPLLLIGLAAATTAWVNPFYVWSDIGWYLSFLAFYGILVVAPLIIQRLRPQHRKSLVALVAAESISAELMTLPFVLYVFGQMSFAGLPANLLVVTFMPLAMLLSLIAGLAGMLVAPIAGWFAWPAAQLLTYMLDISRILAQLPHSFKENIGLTLLQMIGLYAAASILVLALKKKQKPEFLL